MIRNLDYLREKDARLFEAISDIIQQHTNLAQQVNGNPTGQPAAPPAISGLNVTAQNGHFQVAIQDQNQFYRDIHYFVEHADNPHFVNSHVEHLGPSRNANLYLGNVTRYFRAYSSYSSSQPGNAAYHGSQVAPAAVVGGGTDPGPAFLSSQGSGTGDPGQGLSGPGPIAFRTSTGHPPVRGETK